MSHSSQKLALSSTFKESFLTTTSTTIMTPAHLPSPSYFARNGAWLKPAAIGGLLGASHVISASFGATFLPVWLVLAGLLLCTALVAYGARITDTFSATVVERLIGALVVLGVVTWAFKAFSS